MAKPSLVPAEAMSHAVATDPQFRMPRRPRLVPGLVTLPLPDGLLVEGTPTRQALRGTAARDLIPRLLPELDGRREAAELAADLGLSPAHLHQAVSLLYTCGMLEDAAGPAVPEDTPEPVATFLTRSIDSSRVNVSGGEAVRRLAASEVALAVADPVLAGAVRRLLLAAGVGTVRPWTGDPAGVDLVITSGGEPTAGGLTDREPTAGGLTDREPTDGELADREPTDGETPPGGDPSGAGAPVLPVRLAGDVAWLGPYVDTSFTACLSCVTAQRDAAEDGGGPATLDRGLAAETAAALVTADAVALLSRIGSTHVLHGLVRVDLGTWHQRSYPLAALPDCPRCGGGPGLDPGSRPDLDSDPGSRLDPGTDHGSDPDSGSDSGSATGAGPGTEVPVALGYEESVSFPPRRLTNPRDHQIHYRPGNLALQVECKRWPSARHVELPDEPFGPVRGPVPATARVPRPVQLDAATLGALLRRAGGLRDDGAAAARKVQRWAPTGGNLGSPQLHVIVRDVSGLDPAVYGYRADTHRLAVLSWADPYAEVAGLPDAEAVVVVTGALARVASKYSTFAWRVLHLDAGVTLTQLRLAAADRDVATRVVTAWDDAALAALLSAELDEEPVTAVLAINPLESR
ncbi:TOMM precursor leader peptide-binding protein [Streptosporangium sandarakinum]|uniref:TOMM precursor leader peptide-binding protein n=1 Tax=Streptosporangium sandarakinum TaxID=1260955 RepID=UPI003673CCED